MKVITNGVPSFFKMSKEEQKAFFQDSALIAEIIERKREKTKKELLLNPSKVQAIAQ